MCDDTSMHVVGDVGRILYSHLRAIIHLNRSIKYIVSADERFRGCVVTM